MSGPTGSSAPPGAERESRFGWKAYAIAAVAIVLIIFVAQNSQQVEVDFIFATTETPLIFALLIAGALGALIGLLVPRFRRGRGTDDTR